VKSTGFDIRRYAGYKEDVYDKTAAHEQFSKDGDAYFVVRYKKGEDLAYNGTYNPYSTIAGCTDVYRYYEKVNVSPGTTLEEATERDHAVITYNEAPEVGMIVGKSGKIYKNESDCTHNKDVARAIIIYKSDYNDYKNALDNDNQSRTTYAIPLNFSKEGNNGNFMWGIKGKKCADPTDVSTLIGGLDELFEKRNGIKITDQLLSHKEDEHKAAMAARNYTKLTYIDEEEEIKWGEYLNYFLPTVGQWRKVLSGLGFVDTSSIQNGSDLKKAFDELFRKAGISQVNLDLFDGKYIWTSSEVDSDGYNQAFAVRFSTNNGFDFKMEDKDKKLKVIPFIRL